MILVVFNASLESVKERACSDELRHVVQQKSQRI
jgi:hypothetical protein